MFKQYKMFNGVKKRSRKGKRFFHGDDLTKKGLDRKRRSRTEKWERAARA